MPDTNSDPTVQKPTPGQYGICAGTRTHGCLPVICAACMIIFGKMPENDSETQRMGYAMMSHPLFFHLSNIINDESMMDNTKQIMENKPQEQWIGEIAMILLGALHGFNGAQIAMDAAPMQRDQVANATPTNEGTLQ